MTRPAVIITLEIFGDHQFAAPLIVPIGHDLFFSYFAPFETKSFTISL